MFSFKSYKFPQLNSIHRLSQMVNSLHEKKRHLQACDNWKDCPTVYNKIIATQIFKVVNFKRSVLTSAVMIYQFRKVLRTAEHKRKAQNKQNSSPIREWITYEPGIKEGAAAIEHRQIRDVTAVMLYYLRLIDSGRPETFLLLQAVKKTDARVAAVAFFVDCNSS